MENPSEKEEVLLVFEAPIGYFEEARLDVYLTRLVPNATRNKVQAGIKKGHVKVNGTVVRKPSHHVLAGDHIECRVYRPPALQVTPEDIPLDIVFEDEYLLVVNKQAGMVVHPAYGHRSGTLVNALLHHVGASALQLKGDEDGHNLTLSTVNAMPDYPGDASFRPGIVHRLDKDTSGLLVVAKDDATHSALAKQFMERTIQRRYLAIVWGLPNPEKGTIETFLGRDPRDRKRMAVVPEQRGKKAITHYEVIEMMLYTTLVRFRLETGRTHQIRAHAEYMKHPVLGDATYGGQRIRYGLTSASRKAFYHNLFKALPRQALHAHTLGFVHPRTKEVLHFTADLPEDMAFVLNRLRKIEGAG